VPTAMPVWVKPPVVAVYAFAMPKSAILTAPRLVTSTFWHRSSRPIHGRREPRGMCSIAMYGTPSHSKKSNTVTMFGRSKDAAIRDSRMKRSTRDGSLVRRSSRLSATVRPSAGWRAW
jgi:hypothetical protein